MIKGRGRLTPEQWEEKPAAKSDPRPDWALRLASFSPQSSEEEITAPEERELLFIGPKREALDISLLLASQSRPHWFEEVGDEFAVLVPEGRKRVEGRLVRAWKRENHGFFSQIKTSVPTIGPAPLWILTPPIALFFYERLSSGSALWREAGMANAKLMVQGGEWHRAITALTLHADTGHIAGNSFWSFMVLTLLHQRLAWPLAAWLTLFAGIFGNISTVLLRSGDHSSLGFSTAIFGALGLLAGIEFRHPLEKNRRFLRRSVPLAGALFLGIWMGTGEGTDVAAHFFGLLWGLLLGAALPLRALHPHSSLSRIETALLALALWGVLAAAWGIALQVR